MGNYADRLMDNKKRKKKIIIEKRTCKYLVIDMRNHQISGYKTLTKAMAEAKDRVIRAREIEPHSAYSVYVIKVPKGWFIGSWNPVSKL